MKFLVILLFFAISMVQIGESAVLIDQVIFKSVYCNNSLPMFECHVRVQRQNKTAQIIVGNFTVKTQWTNDISMLLTVSYQDHSGIWKGLILRNIHNTCDMAFTKNGMIYDTLKKYFNDLKDGCPAEPASYRVGPKIINRYRKDWEPDMKKLIPPYFLEADNWRAISEYSYKNDPTTIIGQTILEFRLLNDHMSQ